MDNQKDFKEIEEQDNSKESEIIDKYGFDIRKDWLERIKRQDKIWKTIKVVIVLAIIIIIIVSIYSTYRNKGIRESISIIKNYGVANYDIEITAKKIGISGEGFYTYYIKDNPDIEIHGFRQGHTLESDIESRYYKYFFEKWEDSEKSKFVVAESYDDCKYRLTTKKGWLLQYQTYIEVNSYEEMLEATETIIRFKDYMNHPELLIGSYIKVGDNLIQPHNVYPQTNDEIREMAIQLYMQAIDN